MSDILTAKEIEEAVFVEGNQSLDFEALEKVAKAQLAKVLKHRLDRPDGEEIENRLLEVWNMAQSGRKGDVRGYIKGKVAQILALIPTEEEIREQITSWIEKHKAKEPAFHPFDAKGVEDCILIKVKDWQALKEGK